MSTPTRWLRSLAGLLFVFVPIVFTVCFTLLQMRFEYPDILRQPTADILTKFQAGGSSLIVVWYVLTVTALLFVPLSLLLRELLATPENRVILGVATAFGVLAGVVQTLGFLRWPFLVPHLAAAYLAPEATEAQRSAVAIVFDSFHIYIGMGVGEHLGYLCTSVWTFLVAGLMLRSARFGRVLGGVGMLLAVGVAAGLLEPAGLEFAGSINAISYLAWAVWLIVVGMVILFRRVPQVDGDYAHTKAMLTSV